MFQSSTSSIHPHAILVAILSQNVNKVRQLIHEGVDINVCASGGGKTALHMAVENEHDEIASLLIQANANVNVVTERKFTPLHVAAQTGKVTLIQKLLDAGALIDAPSDVGCTPLHEAAAKGHQAAVVILVERGANIHFKEYKFQLTPSQLAARVNQHTVARYLENVGKQSSQIKTSHTLFAKKPMDHSDYLAQAKTAYQQRRYNEAVNLFKKAAETCQGNDKKAPIFCNIGHSYFALKDYNRAIRSYTDVVEISPASITAYEWRAKSYKKLAELSTSHHDREVVLAKVSQDENKVSELRQQQVRQLKM